MAEPTANPEPSDASPPLNKLSPQLILLLGNVVLGLVALGMFVYTKLLFEKPPIVEDIELRKKQEEAKAPSPPPEKALVSFDQMSLNIAMTSGKAHYATIALTVECRDQQASNLVKAKQAFLLDRLIKSMGSRQLTELNTIQGKLLLKTELIRSFNEVISPGAVTDIYFSTFILQ